MSCDVVHLRCYFPNFKTCQGPDNFLLCPDTENHGILYTVSHKSEYTPHISAINLVYIFKGQYYRYETWIYIRVVNVQLV